MPRGGSRKGEHRGNAKPRDGVETPNEVMRAAVKMIRKPAKPGQPGPQGPSRKSIDENVLIAQVVHGRRDARDMSPKEIMLDNMHFFQNAAYMSEAMIQYLLKAAPAGEQRSRDIKALEFDVERNRRIASDEAYKVAPFIHPRLAALAIAGGGDKGRNIVQLMLEEIDKRNRESPMVIEHIPKKRTA